MVARGREGCGQVGATSRVYVCWVPQFVDSYLRHCFGGGGRSKCTDCTGALRTCGGDLQVPGLREHLSVEGGEESPCVCMFVVPVGLGLWCGTQFQRAVLWQGGAKPLNRSRFSLWVFAYEFFQLLLPQLLLLLCVC